MSDRKLAFLYSPELDRLSYPAECPFKTQRAGLTRLRLRSLGLLGGDFGSEVAPAKASQERLLRFHQPEYVEELQRASRGDLSARGLEMGLGGADTPVFPDLFEYGLWACGSALTAADLLLAGDTDVAFSLAGGFHHARADRAAGFCYLNDVVLACAHLAAGGKRVAYVDVDAHHGDGVQEAFYRRSDILNISLHETGRTLFPWGGFENEVGEGPGRGFNVNVPLPPWTYDEAFVDAFQRVAMPLMQAYQPDAVVLELGLDTLAGDPLTHLEMTNNIVVEVLNRLLGLKRPLLIAGGGGYHVENTVRGWALAWRTCLGQDEDPDACTLGLGGVMLGNSEWAGGLHDRALPVSIEQKRSVQPELNAVIERVQRAVFPYHGIQIDGVSVLPETQMPARASLAAAEPIHDEPSIQT